MAEYRDNAMTGSRRRMWKKRQGSNRLSLIKQNADHALVNVEEEFLHAAEFGDIPTVKRLLEENSELNADCIDALGRTALRLAVKNEHLEVVEVLLHRSSGRHIYEAVLQAISAGHIQIAETILKHRRYLEMWKERKKLGDEDHFFKTSFEESQFSPDITPLILTAQKNQYEIVQLLLMRGEVIRKPHKYRCACQECTNKLKYDTLRSAKYRLNAYRGLASEAYISLSSKDPIQTAFELGAELRHLSKIEKYFKKEYKDLADQLSEYVVKLTDRVRTQDELEIVLNKTGKPVENKYENLARLKLAIHYREKKFVAHPSCQQKLTKTWIHGMEPFERASWSRRFFMIFFFILSYPFMVLIHVIYPGAKVIKMMHYPCVKFICHTASFLGFLMLIIVSTAELTNTLSNTRSLRTVYGDVYTIYQTYNAVTNHTLMGNDFPIRSPFPTVSQFFMSIWIVGIACQECNQVFRSGIAVYVKSWYNLMDTALLCLYFASFTLRYFSMIKGQIALRQLRSIDIVHADSETRHTIDWHFYWLNAVDRFYWDAIDPINVGESLFAIANIMSFSRISYLLSVNEALGPLQISLGRMIKDIMKFLLLFILVFGAFMVGLQNLFWYYSVHDNIEVTDHNFQFQAQKYFGNLLATFRTVFWSLFGRGDTEVVTLGDYKNSFTEDTGYIIYGAYNVAMVTVLLNMLIAMMTRSFQDIAEDADVEWKFSRSQLYMDYIGEGATLPVPVNLLGGPCGFIRLLIKSLFCCSSGDDVEPPVDSSKVTSVSQNGHQAKPDENDSTTVEISESTLRPEDMDRRMSSTVNSDTLSYQKVIQTIIQRYIFDIQREEEVTEDDFEEIKQDISSFRYEMLNQTFNTELSNKVDSILEIVKSLKNIDISQPGSVSKDVKISDNS